MYFIISFLTQMATGWSFTQTFRSFGFYIIMALIISYSIWIKELRRRAKEILPHFSYNNRENSDRLEKHVNILLLFGGMFGLAAARLFSILEHSGQFLEAPMFVALSGTKFTFYGGLLGGSIVTIVYARKKHLSVYGLLDACVPALLIGYTIIRLGCHFSGHGDWGIANLSAKPSWLSFAPDWLWAYNYPDNKAVAGIINSNTSGNIHPILQNPVFPTPLYESLFCGFMFIVTWLLRKKTKSPGLLFSIYLVVYGAERLLVEQIKSYSGDYIANFNIKPVELVTILFIITGITFALKSYSKRPAHRKFNHT